MCARGFVPRAEGLLSEEDMAYSREKFQGYFAWWGR